MEITPMKGLLITTPKVRIEELKDLESVWEQHWPRGGEKMAHGLLGEVTMKQVGWW
jgi:hypothetical protein